MREIKYIISEHDNGKSIRMFLKHRGYSTATITLLKKCDNGIVLNQKRAFTNAVLSCGDELIINLTDATSDIKSEDLGFRVVYEDDDILVYDKPAGVVVHPTKIYQSGTLGNDYAYRCESNNIECIFRPVYRIDRNTSGLVLIAKNKLASAVKVKKVYTCICHGTASVDGAFDGAIALCEGSKIKRAVSEFGQSAMTRYSRIASTEKFSVCNVELETGRTHQIRVHFSHAGHPLVGDSLYGREDDTMSRHALHCGHIIFENPITGKTVELISDLPDDMAEFIIANNIL